MLPELPSGNPVGAIIFTCLYTEMTSMLKDEQTLRFVTISNVQHFSEKSISKPGSKVWVLFPQAGKRVTLSANTNQDPPIITLFISDFFSL